MKVSEIGEFGLINLIAELILKKNKNKIITDKGLLIGIGDDAAAWKCQGKIQLATTDSLIQDVHFNLSHISWEELGYKGIAINLSDIAAMGGIPQYALISLSIPGEIEVEHIRTLYQGMISSTNKYGVQIIGGNISSADKVIINIAIHGYSMKTRVLTRSSARPGDQIAITGYTGLSAAGMKILNQKINIDTRAAETLRRAHNQPEPKIKEGQALLENGVKAAIDISDGLLADLKHVCEASCVSAIINQKLVPIHPLLKKYFKDEYESLILTGGEDYELLFTASPKVMGKVKLALPDKTTVIGEIEKGTSGNITVVDTKGKKKHWQKSGWDHFK